MYGSQPSRKTVRIARRQRALPPRLDRLRLEVGEPEGTLENADQFPTGILDQLLGSQYFIEPVRMDPRMFGYLASYLALKCLSWSMFQPHPQIIFAYIIIQIDLEM